MMKLSHTKIAIPFLKHNIYIYNIYMKLNNTGSKLSNTNSKILTIKIIILKQKFFLESNYKQSNKIQNKLPNE